MNKLYLEVIRARYDDSQLASTWETHCVDVLTSVGEERILAALKDIPSLVAEIEQLRDDLETLKVHHVEHHLQEEQRT